MHNVQCCVGRQSGHVRTVKHDNAHTFNCDDLHAFNCVQRAKARVDGPVDDAALLPIRQHDSASTASSLATAQLGACKSTLCGRQVADSAGMIARGLRARGRKIRLFSGLDTPGPEELGRMYLHVI